MTLETGKSDRCSDRGSCLADAVSKGEVSVLQKEWPSSRSLVELPRSIINWVKDPVEDLDLGTKVLKDLEARGLEVVVIGD